MNFQKAYCIKLHCLVDRLFCLFEKLSYDSVQKEKGSHV